MLVLVTGGAASGKSGIAEDICTGLGERVAYIATMQPYGEEAKYRVARHLKLREGKGFTTIEQYTDIGGVFDKLGSSAGTLLIECMSNLCANELFSPDGAHEKTAAAVVEGIFKLAGHYPDIVVVTSEVFSDDILYEGGTLWYMEVLGEINRELAGAADAVVEAFYGIPLVRKDNSGRLKGMMKV